MWKDGKMAILDNTPLSQKTGNGNGNGNTVSGGVKNNIRQLAKMDLSGTTSSTTSKSVKFLDRNNLDDKNSVSDEIDEENKNADNENIIKNDSENEKLNNLNSILNSNINTTITPAPSFSFSSKPVDWANQGRIDYFELIFIIHYVFSRFLYFLFVVYIFVSINVFFFFCISLFFYFISRQFLIYFSFRYTKCFVFDILFNHRLFYFPFIYPSRYRSRYSYSY